jgi:hypothetical protein
VTIDDRAIARIPPAVEAIGRDTNAIGYTMASEPKTGSLLMTLAATKPMSTSRSVCFAKAACT